MESRNRGNKNVFKTCKIILPLLATSLVLIAGREIICGKNVYSYISPHSVHDDIDRFAFEKIEPFYVQKSLV